MMPDPSSQKSPPVQLTTVEIEKKVEEDKLWYYLDQNRQQVGPVSLIAVRELWNRGQLELTSLVWTKGMEQWQKIDDLSELKNYLR